MCPASFSVGLQHTHANSTQNETLVDCVWNVMAHAQKPDYVFRVKRTSPFKSAGGRQFSRLLAAEVCASAVVMLDTPCSEVVWRVLATHCIHQFPLHFPPPPVRHRVPSHFNWTLLAFFFVEKLEWLAGYCSNNTVIFKQPRIVEGFVACAVVRRCVGPFWDFVCVYTKGR